MVGSTLHKDIKYCQVGNGCLLSECGTFPLLFQQACTQACWQTLGDSTKAMGD